jgi:hypothetical protein
VRNADEWDWLRSLLSIAKVKELLGEEYKGGKIDRFEIPNLVSVQDVYNVDVQDVYNVDVQDC